jgi:hypothetical protein
MPAGGSGSEQHTSAGTGNVAGDPSAATVASSASASSPPPAAVKEVPAAFAPTMRGDTGADVAPSGLQDPPVTVEAMPSGSQVRAGGPEVAVPPTVTADPMMAIPSDTPSAVGVGGGQIYPVANSGGSGGYSWVTALVWQQTRSNADSPPSGAVSRSSGPPGNRGGYPAGVGGARDQAPVPWRLVHPTGETH